MLGPITIAYETWGELNATKSNAVLVEHALTGDSHAHGPDEVRAFALRFDEPLDWTMFALWLAMLLQARGDDVLRAAAARLRDVVGDAGIVCPLVPEQWVAALDEVRSRRTALVAAGHERAKQFTSAVSGAALSTAYAAAMERG